MQRSANLSADAALLDEAKALQINLSRVFEAGLKRAVADAKSERWRRENAEAIAGSNAWVEANGLPLDRHRQF